MINNYYKCKEELIELMAYPDNWDYCGASKPKVICIRLAKKLIDLVNEKPRHFDFEVIPNIDGCISLAFGINEDWFEIKVLENSFNYRIEKGVGYDYEVIEEEEYQSLNDILKKFDNLWNSLESYKEKKSLRNVTEFIGSHSLHTMEGFRFSTKNVQLSQSPTLIFQQIQEKAAFVNFPTRITNQRTEKSTLTFSLQ